MAIFLFAGKSKSVKAGDIIGIFDMDTSTVSRVTRDFLFISQKRGQVENVCDDIPKAYIITSEKNKKNSKVIITQVASTTLKERLKRKIQ
ncbi:MAG: DUF370 domain-containing protein [Ruminococcaceae bacterium]|nr:DUF370 domain-containing protein [Oscillospiraceae bacterium]